jgi:hypothetical protein
MRRLLRRTEECTMSDETAYIDLLNRREYVALEDLAIKQLSRSPDVLSALMVTQSRLRRGLFDQGIDAIYKLGELDPGRQALVHDLVSMCTREQEQVALESDPSERERLDDMDLWRRCDATATVRGQVLLDDGRRTEFADVVDVDPFVGRRLLVFGLDRPWRIPFESIAHFELSPKSPMVFDDLWLPASIALKPGQGIQHITARVPAFYKRSLAHTDPQIASGRATRVINSTPIGLRDYQFSFGTKKDLVGIHQIRGMAFRS